MDASIPERVRRNRSGTGDEACNSRLWGIVTLGLSRRSAISAHQTGGIARVLIHLGDVESSRGTLEFPQDQAAIGQLKCTFRGQRWHSFGRGYFAIRARNHSRDGNRDRASFHRFVSLIATGDADMRFEQLAGQYRGATAQAYERARAKQEKWVSEQRIVENYLETLPEGSSVADIPIGTGRFVAAYHRLRLNAAGFDISPDMIALAAGKACKIGLDLPLHIADIRSLDAANGAFDAAVCICFLNWIDIDGTRTALRELTRVTRETLIIGIRHYTPFSMLHAATPAGFGQWLLQLGARIYKLLDRGSLRVHERADIFAMFGELGLEVKQQIRVVPRKYGTDYYIYLLKKL